MTLEIVDPTSTEVEHLTSVDVQFSGTHIGGGIYLATNHNPDTDGRILDAIPQRSLTGEAEAHNATEIDYVVAVGANPADYLEIANGDGSSGAPYVGFDTSLFYGDRLTNTSEFYAGPAASLLIANDPGDLTGVVTILGYPSAPNSLDGSEGTLHQTTGILSTGAYFEQTVGADQGGYFLVLDAEGVDGMSGGGNFIDFDPDGDGITQTFLIGTTSRAGSIEVLPGPTEKNVVQSASLSPHYADLSAAIGDLTGDAERKADDFSRMTLLSAQTVGASNTTVQGQFFHEDLYGSLNEDTLLGAGGDDHLYGGGGSDSLSGGVGDDRLSGGDGNDVLSGGLGADVFLGGGFGNGATDIITDFNAQDGDIIELSSHFTTFDEVLAATTELNDGSIIIALPGGSGGGMIQVLNTSLADLRASHVNVICFTEDTMILTPDGDVPILDLHVGQQVVTFGGATRVLRAVNIRRLGANELRSRPSLWPVVIEPGALGVDRPAKRLTVSPQHRMLVDSEIAYRKSGAPVLVAAKKLLSLPGFSQPRPEQGCKYIHLVFDQHEVIKANGCWSESFFPGPQALKALPAALAREYREIFDDRLAPAFPIMDHKSARILIKEHAQQDLALQRTLTGFLFHGLGSVGPNSIQPNP